MTTEFHQIDHVHPFVIEFGATERWYERVTSLKHVAALAFWAVDGGPLNLANASDSKHIALFVQPREAYAAAALLLEPLSS